MVTPQKYFVRTGESYGKWEVLRGAAGKSLCKCSCGRERVVDNSRLVKGLSTKCKDCHVVVWNKTGRRGSTRKYDCQLPYPVYTRLQHAVANAIARCTRREHPQYDGYGGRGISVHPVWLENPLLFIEYLSTLPGHDDAALWLDRENNNGNYEPGNLRFVTPKVSAQNTRKKRPRRSRR